jgi:anti-sigma factor RsiW
MAREYSFFNLEELENHLAQCAGCREELARLREVDRTLAKLPGAHPPEDLTDSIMNSIKRGTLPDVSARKRAAGGWPGLFRDLVAAAAVSMLLFWAGGDILNSNNLDLAGQRVEHVAQGYFSTSEEAVNMAYSKMGNISELLTKEWIKDEVR